MAVKIRLQRCGAKHAPVYRIVAADSRAPRDGRFIEALGTYNPKARGAAKELEVKLDRIDHWLKVGAQMTDTARSLVKRGKKLEATAATSEEKEAPAQPTKQEKEEAVVAAAE